MHHYEKYWKVDFLLDYVTAYHESIPVSSTESQKRRTSQIVILPRFPPSACSPLFYFLFSLLFILVFCMSCVWQLLNKRIIICRPMRCFTAVPSVSPSILLDNFIIFLSGKTRGAGTRDKEAEIRDLPGNTQWLIGRMFTYYIARNQTLRGSRRCVETSCLFWPCQTIMVYGP